MNGFGDSTLQPLRAVPPSEAQSYLATARGLFAGAEDMTSLPSQNSLACAFLSAQTLECALKAFLSSSGWTEKKLRQSQICHNLEALWVEAVGAGLSVEPQPPQWCLTLNASHNKPFYFRYPMGLNAMSFPALAPMVAELKGLLKLIAGIVR